MKSKQGYIKVMSTSRQSYIKTLLTLETILNATLQETEESERIAGLLWARAVVTKGLDSYQYRKLLEGVK
jgi:hypothetical protein